MATTIINNFINTWDEDARNYLLAVEQADGQPLERNIWVAVNAFVVGCKKDNIWDKLHTVGIMCDARTLSGCLVPLKGSAPTNYGFEPGDYERKTGLKGDGETKYLGSNVANDAFGLNDVHAGLAKDNASSSAKFVMGADFRFTIGSAPTRCNNGTPNLSLGTLADDNWVAMSRDNPSNFNYMLNTSSGVHNVESTSNSSREVFVFRRNETTGQWSDNRIRFYTLGWAVDLSVLGQRVTALMTGITNAF